MGARAGVAAVTGPPLVVSANMWLHGHRLLGTSSVVPNLLRPLEVAGQSHTHFAPDVWLASYPGGDIDAQLLRVTQGAAALLLSWEGTQADPDWRTVEQIRRRGTRVAVIWWDVSGQPCDALPVDLHIVHHPEYLRRAADPARYLLHWIAHDPAVYHAGGDPVRDLEVVFSGSVGGYRDGRAEHLAALRAAGVVVHVVQTRADEPRPEWSAYADLLRRAKIAVNWCIGRSAYPGGGLIDQFKGRVGEACRCGAMLLEQRNTETRRWLHPGRDYAEFGGSHELVQMARFYLDHAADRERIAETGARRHAADYTCERWWAPIAARLGL